jgi:hypothetical protein
VSSVAVVAAVLLMTGASLTAAIVTVALCTAEHRFGVAPSQICTATTQLAGGVGPAGVNENAPVAATMEPAQVCVGVTRLQVCPGPSGSLRVAA